EMGAQRTRLNVQHNGQSVFTREAAFGGQLLADELVDRFDLPDSEQLLVQLREGRIEVDEFDDSLNGFCDQAAREIEGALQFYFSPEAQTEALDQVLVTGGRALHPEFMTRLRERLIWPVATANPLDGVRLSKAATRNHVEADSPTLMVAT